VSEPLTPRQLRRLVEQVDAADRRARLADTGVDENKLTTIEQAFCAMAANRGRRVIRNGWPDFLVEDPKTGKTIAVEVKSNVDALSPEQRRMFAALERLGIRVFVWRPKNPRSLSPWSSKKLRKPREDREQGPRLPAVRMMRRMRPVR
jgi:hypothetical protein